MKSSLKDIIGLKEASIKKIFIQYLQQFPAGDISRNEMAAKFSDIFPRDIADNVTAHIFEEFDVNNNGKIDFCEFLVASQTVASAKPETKLSWVFRMIDKDNSGVVSLAEIVEVFAALYRNEGIDMNLAIERATSVFRWFDADNNGEVTAEEFIGLCSENQDLFEFLE